MQELDSYTMNDEAGIIFVIVTVSIIILAGWKLIELVGPGFLKVTQALIHYLGGC